MIQFPSQLLRQYIDQRSAEPAPSTQGDMTQSNLSALYAAQNRPRNIGPFMQTPMTPDGMPDYRAMLQMLQAGMAIGRLPGFSFLSGMRYVPGAGVLPAAGTSPGAGVSPGAGFVEGEWDWMTRGAGVLPALQRILPILMPRVRN